MMRSPKSFVVAVRRPDGSIAVREQEWDTLWPRLGFLRWPLLRGAVVLLESMHNGFSALKFSSDHALPSEAAKVAKGEGGTNALLAIATAAMALLFIALPHLLTYAIGRFVGPSMDVQGPLFHLVDGALRIAILLGYILALSRTAEARRLFQYHGAEHKVIWAYESGGPLTVERAQTFSTLHPRCGTSFLFVVVSVAVLVHAVVIPIIPRMASSDVLNQLLLVLVKIPMAFPIAGIAYELQRLSAKDDCPRFISWLTRPGMWMQKITTREPSADQLEIAVLALERSLAREEGRAVAAVGVKIYADFASSSLAA